MTKAMEKLKGRKPIIRSLPPLEKACVAFRGFRAGENRTERIYQLLSVAIKRFRRSTPRPFYSVREAITFFGVSITTVARVYRRLDREGMLTLMRSSQSLITARAPRPRYKVRGVVCMPIWLPGFLYFLDWRKWFSQLEEELSHYHFVLEPIFYKANEETEPAFVDRVLRFNPDYVLWNWPCEADRTTMHSIADTGVALVLIQYEQDQQFPGRVYRVSYERGLRQGLTEWAASGKIKNIVIPQSSLPKDTISLSIRSVLKACPLPCRYGICPGEGASTADLLSYLRELAPNRRTGVVFGDDILYAQLCAQVPEAMLEFIRRHRVIVTRQVTTHLRRSTPPPGITVDAVLYSLKKLARRIAMDLGRSKGAIPSTHSVLEAEWRPQIPLASVVQTVCDE